MNIEMEHVGADVVARVASDVILGEAYGGHTVMDAKRDGRVFYAAWTTEIGRPAEFLLAEVSDEFRAVISGVTGERIADAAGVMSAVLFRGDIALALAIAADRPWMLEDLLSRDGAVTMINRNREAVEAFRAIANPPPGTFGARRSSASIAAGVLKAWGVQ